MASTARSEIIPPLAESFVDDCSFGKYVFNHRHNCPLEACLGINFHWFKHRHTGGRVALIQCSPLHGFLRILAVVTLSRRWVPRRSLAEPEQQCQVDKRNGT